MTEARSGLLAPNNLKTNITGAELGAKRAAQLRQRHALLERGLDSPGSLDRRLDRS